MVRAEHDLARGLPTLRAAVAACLLAGVGPLPAPAAASAGPSRRSAVDRGGTPWLLAETVRAQPARKPVPGSAAARAAEADSAPEAAEHRRLTALVELSRDGDREAFGLLYDHYHPGIYRFLYYRVGSVPLAEDLTSETFFRALRSMGSFRWQGRDFGAWLTTIARNLTADHFKAGRTRLETPVEDITDHDEAEVGPEDAVLASLTNDALLTALAELSVEQRECLVMRFLQGLSISETARVLGRSAGAVKQLQLRGVRNLARLLPEGSR